MWQSPYNIRAQVVEQLALVVVPQKFLTPEVCSSKSNIGRGVGCQMVIMLAFYSNDPSSNPAEVYNFLYGNTNKQKQYLGWPLFQKNWQFLFNVDQLKDENKEKGMEWERNI